MTINITLDESIAKLNILNMPRYNERFIIYRYLKPELLPYLHQKMFGVKLFE
ncbi:MAG: hypothetical protein PVG65_01345 [Candidatus Thorarchaeota archaeon]